MQSNLGSIDSLLREIYEVFGHAAESGREDLNEEEIEYITRITTRMIKEKKMKLNEIAHLLPEEIPQAVVMHTVDEGRSELNAEEIEYITRITKRMIKETKMQLGEIAHLLPEEIPQETVDKILRGNRGLN